MKTNTNAATIDRQAGATRSIHDAVDQAASSAHAAIDKAVSAADFASAWLSERGDKVKTAPNELLEKSTDYVAAHPVKALVIALVAGVVLSKLAR